MLKYKYVQANYISKIGLKGISRKVKLNDIIEVDEKEREQFDTNPDFELLEGVKTKMTEKDVREIMSNMKWRAFQKYAKKRWGVSDTNKEELIQEIIKKIGGEGR